MEKVEFWSEELLQWLSGNASAGPDWSDLLILLLTGMALASGVCAFRRRQWKAGSPPAANHPAIPNVYYLLPESPAVPAPFSPPTTPSPEEAPSDPAEEEEEWEAGEFAAFFELDP